MRPKVLLYKPLPDDERQRLAMHFDIMEFDGFHRDNEIEFLAALREAEGIIGGSGIKLPTERLEQASKLKVASTISVGTDQYDLDYLARRNIPVMHTPGVLNETTADTMFALLMCTARRALELSNMVKEGRWKHTIGPDLYGTDVHGKTLGIVGMGRIGQAIAKRAHLGFDMKIQYFNRTPNPQAEKDYDAQYLSLENLLSSSDFICVMTPLSASTQGLIGEREFALMKPDCIFINGSRGKVIDESALIKALQTKQIRAAGLDVFQQEPLPANSPLCQLDNAVLFPHIGSATVETRRKMITCAVDNLIRAMSGDISQNCANGHLLKNSR
ncbi:2-hydroxyacid dehydrogenase [Marinomonas posidonica]|uniref:Glyoxylate/hydroxypyruvate reductase B n=1 Tax=Marinomonas posidonica (strain CECT 7376 / NCIMB 14433 / IVIA-Po-181) TaxID=491952 RepID=F6D0V4_MARPP|nr:D-glycerate dehydrogenase [Marinomonas posidonica]AEF55986.1 Gluconate 2-dehydrogenase [Marinomonas posidonica IVIA-Po-181]